MDKMPRLVDFFARVVLNMPCRQSLCLQRVCPTDFLQSRGGGGKIVAMPEIDAPILGRMLRPLASGLRDELLKAVACMEADPAEEARYHELADRNAQGVITTEERRELGSIVSANTLLSILRAEARASLASRAA